MSTRAIGTILLIGAVLICGFRVLYDDGITGMTKKPNHIFINPGCICHGDSATPSTRVWIQGPDSVRAGQVELFKISVARDSNIAAGFNVAAFYGSLDPFDTSEAQLMQPDFGDSLELTHTHPKLADGGDTISWRFYYRAPTVAGTIDTIYANANSVNLSGDPDGDFWNFAPNFLVRVVSPTDVQEYPVAGAFRLEQNYPNPFNGQTTISFSIPYSAFTTLKIFNTLGQEIATLVTENQSPGTHSTRWNATNAASGVYYYRLTAGEFAQTKELILLR